MMADKKIHPLQSVPFVMITSEPAAFETEDNILWKVGMKSLFCTVCLFYNIVKSLKFISIAEQCSGVWTAFGVEPVGLVQPDSKPAEAWKCTCTNTEKAFLQALQTKLQFVSGYFWGLGKV